MPKRWVIWLLGGYLLVAAPVLWIMWRVAKDADFAAQKRLEELHRGNLKRAAEEFFQVRFGDWQMRFNAYQSKGEKARWIFERAAISPLGAGLQIFHGNGDLIYPSSEVPERNTPESAKVELEKALKQIREWSSHPDSHHLAAELALKIAQDKPMSRILTERGSPWGADLALLVLAAKDLNLTPDFVAQLSAELSKLATDYTLPVTSPRRAFLLNEASLFRGGNFISEFLDAERLAALSVPGQLEAKLRKLPELDVWHFGFPSYGVRMVFRTSKLAGPWNFEETSYLILAPEQEPPADNWLIEPVNRQMPGWRIASEMNSLYVFRQGKLTLWVGVSWILLVGVLITILASFVSHQLNLAAIKNDLAATVSHELKTPLTSIRILTDTLLSDEELPPKERRKALTMVSRENARLTRLIEQFLNFSRMSRGQMPELETSEVEPKKMVHDAIEAVPSLESEGCVFELKLAPKLPKIEASPDALVTALVNLLENATKHTPEPRQISLTVDLTETRDALEFHVTDNGPGLSKTQQNRIFQPFFQTNQNLSRSAEGCGLGLSIVKWIVEAHHGSVSIESTPGKGCTFILSLPITL